MGLLLQYGLHLHEARLQNRVALLREYGSTAAVVMAYIMATLGHHQCVRIRGATYKEASVQS